MPGYWNAHSDRDFEDQLHEPPDDEDEAMPDNDPQPRAILDPGFLLDTVRAATKALYPEARMPETPMPTVTREAELEQRIAELMRQLHVARRNIRMALNVLDHPIEHVGDRAEIKERLQRILRETD